MGFEPFVSLGRRHRQRQLGDGDGPPRAAAPADRVDLVGVGQAHALNGHCAPEDLRPEREGEIVFDDREEPDGLLRFAVGVDDGLLDAAVRARPPARGRSKAEGRVSVVSGLRPVQADSSTRKRPLRSDVQPNQFQVWTRMDVGDIEPSGSQMSAHFRMNALVRGHRPRRTSRARLAQRDDAVMLQGVGGEAERLLDVFWRQMGVGLEDLRPHGAGGEEVEQELDADPGSL